MDDIKQKRKRWLKIIVMMIKTYSFEDRQTQSPSTKSVVAIVLVVREMLHEDSIPSHQ